MPENRTNYKIKVCAYYIPLRIRLEECFACQVQLGNGRMAGKFIELEVFEPMFGGRTQFVGFKILAS